MLIINSKLAGSYHFLQNIIFLLHIICLHVPLAFVNLFKRFFLSMLFLPMEVAINVEYVVLDVQECSTINPCLNNGTCFNNNGSYSCQCTEGWQGQNCETGW